MAKSKELSCYDEKDLEPLPSAERVGGSGRPPVGRTAIGTSSERDRPPIVKFLLLWTGGQPPESLDQLGQKESELHTILDSTNLTPYGIGYLVHVAVDAWRSGSPPTQLLPLTRLHVSKVFHPGNSENLRAIEEDLIVDYQERVSKYPEAYNPFLEEGFSQNWRVALDQKYAPQ